MPQNYGSLLSRFWTKVDCSAGLFECWNWTASVDKDGYGWFGLNGKNVHAHRYSYELANGPIPIGAQVLHSCDNSRCVNPAHLHLGTQWDNIHEMLDRGRDKPPRGATHHWTKLTENDVVAIRTLHATGKYTYRQLGDMYQVNKCTVGLIIRGKNWRHLK